MSINCDICLNVDQKLVIINENHPEKDAVIDKLRKCVPEVQWELNVVFCESCMLELHKIHAFRELCIQSFLSKKDIIKVEEYETVQFDDASDRNESEEEEEIVKGRRKPKDNACEHCGKHVSSLKKHYVNCKRNLVESTGLEEYLEFKPEKLKDEVKNEYKCNKTKSTKENSDPPLCNICGSKFSNKYLLKRHLKNVHATEKNYKCDLCERTFASLVYLNAHKQYHSGDRSHICSFCGKGFITASDLYHHEKIHANKRAYRCQLCPKAFNTSSDLHKHKICVHSDKSKWKYVCTYCEKRFPLKINLDTHTKTHTGEKNFPCQHCERRFINKSILMRHVETHTNFVPFKCSHCAQSYKYQKSLDIHMYKVHGIGNMTVSEKVKKYFCHICPKSYFENNKLVRHIRMHTGERPFKCPDCNKSFVDKSYVKQHQKTHAVLLHHL